MPIELEGLEVVDSHCHPFLPALENPDFVRCWTLSTLPIPGEDIQSTVLFQMMAARLARFLGMPKETAWSEIVEERSSRYRESPSDYIGSLFDDAGLTTLLIDIGYPSIEDEGVEIDPAEFRSMLRGRDVRHIVRIEPVMHDLLGRELPFREFVPAFRAALQKEADIHSAVAFKTTIAYYTGLEVQPVSATDAERAYGAVLKGRSRSGEADRESEKLYRDFVLLEAVEVAIADHLPLQIHTGMGNAPGISLQLADPANLQWLLADGHFSEAAIVLVHAGYPHHAGAAFLVSTHPNVWLDVSEMVPFIGAGIGYRLRELFDTVPLRKVMYGSDGFNIPELFWFAAHEFKKGVTQTMGALVEQGYVSEAFACEATAGILAGNARRLYQL